MIQGGYAIQGCHEAMLFCDNGCTATDLTIIIIIMIINFTQYLVYKFIWHNKTYCFQHLDP